MISRVPPYTASTTRDSSTAATRTMTARPLRVLLMVSGPDAAGGHLCHVVLLAPAPVGGAQDILHGFPLSHVQDRQLHVTLDQTTDQPAARIPPSERDVLVAELTDATRVVEPFDLMLGSLLSSRYGVIPDLHPDEHLAASTTASATPSAPCAARPPCRTPGACST
ncbi:hypothetical protein [Streptomyces huasconensis]|uniref:hypothetical protein n=1 Tax=Streptomyces huasconensis TaxID=1854574 RepID=UPI003405FE0D